MESLYVEANEPSLYLRREKLALQFISKIKSNPKNPVHDIVFNAKYSHLYDRKPTAIKPLGLRILDSIQSSQLNLHKVMESKILNSPPWQLKTPNVDLTLCNNNKSNTDHLVLRT